MIEENFRGYDADLHDYLEEEFREIVEDLKNEPSKVLYCKLVGESEDMAVGGPSIVEGEVEYPLGRVTTLYLDAKTGLSSELTSYRDEIGQIYKSSDLESSELPFWAVFQAEIFAAERLKRLLSLDKNVFFKNELVEGPNFREVHSGNIEDLLFGSKGRLDYLHLNL